MANTGVKGISCRQTGTALLFWADLYDSTGAFVTAGTTNLYIQEIQSDGSINSYDFSSNTFKSTALTTEVQAMTYRKSNNATTDTGLWTFALSTLTGFTVGAVYRFMVNNTNAYPATTAIKYFQYGSAEGDLITLAGSTGQAYLEADVEKWLTGTIPAVNVTGVPLVDAKYLLGTIFSTPATAGILDVNVKNIVNAAAAIDGNNLLKVDAEDWKGGVIPAVNVTGVPKVDVVDWLGSAPNSLNAGRVDAAANVRSNTAQAGAASTITLDAGASATDNLYQDCLVFLTGGTGAGQVRSIQSYVGSTKVATVFPAWTTQPTSSSTFTIIPMGQVDLGNVLNTVPTVSTAAGVLDVALTSKGVDNIVAETGLNLRQAIAIIAAACGGKLAGNGTTTVTIDAANNAGTHRIVATIDASDNRTAVTLTPPA